MTKSTVATCISLALGTTAALSASSSAWAQSARNAPLEEIVVTATKRDQTLSEIPMSVTVLDGDALQRQQAFNLEDLVPLVPGMSIASDTKGITRVTLRGLNTGGIASTIGTYVDEVPFGSSTGFANAAILSGDFDTFDMSRVEVLRGPQGTLYGASSLAGVMKYVPNRPNSDALEFSLQAGAETVDQGDVGYDLSGAVNIPVTDSFAVRASGFYRADDGFVDSIGNNPIPLPSTVPYDNFTLEDDNFNTVDTYGGRLQALYAPSDSFSVNFMALAQNIESGGGASVDADPATYEPLYGELARSIYHPNLDEIDYRLYSATVDWDFGPMTLQSITSYSTFEQTIQDDIDPLLAQTLTGVLPLLGLSQGEPIGAILNQRTYTDKVTQEFRLISPDNDTFEWLVGFYYTDEEAGLDPQEYLGVEAGTENVIDFPLVLGAAGIDSTYTEYALFGNGTWHFTDRFELEFGARFSDNDQDVEQFLNGVLLGLVEPDVDTASSSESPFTWSIAPRFQLSDDTAIYARAATGFRPGGPNIIPPTAPPDAPSAYDSDSLTNYEIGIKTGGDKYTLEVTAFLLDWEDIQVLTTFGEGQEQVNTNANGGTAESKGLELASAFQPTDNLNLFLNVAYTDAQLTEDAPGANGFDGDELPYVPEWSASVGGDYEWPLANDHYAYVGTTISYTGDRMGTFRASGADPVTGEKTPLPRFSPDAYTLVNLRAGYVAGPWSVELYGRNVTNELGGNFGNIDSLLPNGAIQFGITRPRTWGISAGYRF